MSEEEVAARRSSPRWSEYLATAAAVLREARTEQEWRYQPGLLDGITASTLMLIGTESPHPLLKSTLEAMAAIPGARAHVLAGHGHLALLTDPDMVGDVITRFVND
jgi:pimeloyl-ACP methyl ester carboxylesterase